MISRQEEIADSAKHERTRFRPAGLALLGLVAMVAIILAMPLGHATASTVYTDKADYHPDETVTIYGYGFTPGANITIIITRGDGSVDSCNASGYSGSLTINGTVRLSPCPLTSDAYGNFTEYYELDGVTGAYSVVATDGTSIASTAFTDAVSINILGADANQHTTQANEENLGFTGPGILNKTITVKATGLGNGNTLSWNLVYVASAENNSILFPVTTLNPSSGTLTKSGNSAAVNLKITTSSLAAGTYHGELEATGTGVSPTPSPGFYYFKFTLDKTVPVITPNVSPTPNGYGWNNGNVTVTWSVSDPESGIVSTLGCGTTNLTSETSGTTVTCSATNGAGLSNSVTVIVKIDKTHPTITGSASPSANSNGWNNGPVTVSFSCADSLSGVASVSTPTTLTGEGTGQSATGSCTDNAGNTSSVTVAGTNIDLTPPTITGSRSPNANSLGWNNGPVTASFTCSDSLSGVSSLSSPITISSEDSGQSATGTCTDKAGNTASTSVTGINIDLTPPTLIGSRSPSSNSNGWNNANVTVSFTCTDGLSGVNTGPTSPQVVSTEGASQARSATCTDKAGNLVTTAVGGISIDKTPPTVSGSKSPAPNGNDWTNGAVTVSFTCTDSLSGVASSPSSQIVSTEGGGQSRTGTCTDEAGNSASATVSDINIDLTSPTITGSRSSLPNGNGWNNAPVTVSFTCSDTLSGTSSISSPTTLSEGAGQSVTGSCTDKAGNSASTTISPINIDLTPPFVTGTRSPVADSNGWNNGDVTVAFSCTDALSGVDLVPPSQVVSSDGSGQSRTGTCIDKAGNSASATVGGISIDKAPPVITGSPSPGANSYGWNNVNVTVSFTCTDALSGVAVAPISPQVVTTEGSGQSLTGSCTDLAGNVATATVGAINIDKTLPTISGSKTPAANAYDWNNGPVTVTFTCSDALSGVATGPTTPQVVSTEGAGQSGAATCTDQAGNSASATVGDINIDLTNPTITSSRSVLPNSNGWNNVPVTISFACSDSLSGVLSVSPPTTLGEGGSQSVTGTCTDKAGNSALTIEGPVNIDLTPPTIVGTKTPANGLGWNNGTVTVSFTCNDSLSGVASFSSPTTLSGEGAGQSVSGICADKAGNSAATTVDDVNIDLTPPIITASQSPGPNFYGWNNFPVTVSFACSDALSGTVYTSPATTLGEGTDQSVTGTCIDKAGNSASTSEGGINVDLTPPAITASRSPTPNANGWNNVPVTVSFGCSDALSGVLNVSSPIILTEGKSQTASGTCTDLAGNSATESETGVNVDLTAPTISGSQSPGPNFNGWNNGPVTVSFSCQDSLSGVDSFSGPAPLSIEGGEQFVVGHCYDKAGNTASTTVSNINIDLTAPSITASRSPLPNPNGWSNVTVTVSFGCTDELSGVDSSSGPTVLGEGANQSVTGTCTDRAGNSASTTMSGINIDLTPPAISGTPSPSANANNWNNGNVTVSFSCADSLSGVYSCSSPTVLANEGADQHVTGYVTDLAGNTASATVSNINIDKTPPTTIGLRAPAPNANDWNNVDVIVTFTCSDGLSGVDLSPLSPQKVSTEGAGQFRTGTCVDRAGNAASATVSDINIDKTAPSIVGSRSPSANSHDWTNTPVTVTFACSDALSGVASSSPPTVLGEGASQSVNGTCIDLAGNSASTAIANINVDLTNPVITSSRSAAPNSHGWYNVPVTVSFACSDALSGVDGSFPPITLGEGNGQSATGTCTDLAGNTVTTTDSGINVDLTPPVITASRSPSANANGWNNVPVAVTFSCSDSLSGVLSVSPMTTFGEGAAQSALGSCVDLAGNSVSASISGVNVDLTPPVIAGFRTPIANAHGWNNVDVVTSFTCSDSLSGIAVSPVSPQTVTGEGSGQWRTASCTDKAGNTASTTVSGINIDKTAPNLSGSRAPLANVFGWNNVSVTVTFGCSDALSGVASSSAPTILSAEGTGQSVTGNCVDNAGNTSNLTVGSGINIDKTPPQTSISLGNPKFVNGGTTQVSLTTPFTLQATDSLSGVYQTKYGLDSPSALGIYSGPFTVPSRGVHTIYFESVDKALNAETLHSISVIVGATTITYVGNIQGAYSNPVSIKAVLVEVASQNPITSKLVSFTLGAQSATATTNSTGFASSIITVSQAAGNYTLTSSFAGDASFQPSSVTIPFTILKQTSSLNYSGDTVVSTGAKSITLSATIQETQDGYLGNITRAKISFRIYTSDNSQTLLLTSGPVAVVQTSPGVGLASMQIANMQENTYLIMVSLDPSSNSYYAAPTTDPVVLTVYQPTGSFATGGGWIVDSSGSHGNFGFVVHYNSAGNVQGHAVYVYRVGGLDYMIKSNSWIGMAIVGNHAYFQGKATLQVMDSATGVLLYSVGNYQFRVDVYDNTGTTVNNGQDTYQITVWDNSGLVYHQAAGNLMGGQVIVHDSKP